MNTLSAILAITLLLIALLHFAWALGSTFPCKDEESLAKTVVGARGILQMPPKWASLLVSICLIGASIWALSIRGLGPVKLPQILAFLGGSALTTIFTIRGIAGVLPSFEKMAPEHPFLKLNRRLYSPLSFQIGIGFALLTLAMPNWGWRFGG